MLLPLLWVVIVLLLRLLTHELNFVGSISCIPSRLVGLKIISMKMSRGQRSWIVPFERCNTWTDVSVPHELYTPKAMVGFSQLIHFGRTAEQLKKPNGGLAILAMHLRFPVADRESYSGDFR